MCDEYGGWGRSRRSLYEGVNVPPPPSLLPTVSVPVCVPCIARYRLIHYVCLNKQIVMSLSRPFHTTRMRTKYGGVGMFTR